MTMSRFSLKKPFHNIGEWILKGNNRVKLFFLALSAFLWFLIKLSQNGYTDRAELPVEFYNYPKNQALLNQPDQRIKLSLQSNGFGLLKYKYFFFRKLEVDLSNLEQDRSGRSFWIPGRNLLDLEDQLKEGAKILEVSPDTIFFDFAEISSKKVPVVLQYENLIADENYVVYGKPRIEPDSLVVSGPKRYLDKIDSLLTEPIKLTSGRDSIFDGLKLQLPVAEDYIKVAAMEVKAKLELSPLVEGSVESKILAFNVPDSLGIELLPQKVQITFSVPLKDYSKIRADEFLVYADYRNAKNKGDGRFLTLSLQSVPAAVRSARLDPKRVEFILTQP
jgi:hypothetical protein